MFEARMDHPGLDRIDLRILDVLQREGALSAAELAERVDLAVTTCWRRVKRLEGDGVIRERVALLDREKVGLGVTVFAHVKLVAHGRDNLGRFDQAIRRHPEVLECYTLMGDWDFLLRIVARDIKAYEAFFLDHLSKIPGIQSFSSSIAMTVVKETTQLPILRR
ncbi:MAG: Lrp/AsnC family transcriptional regulator [Steroidobacteraceae bacterium]